MLPLPPGSVAFTIGPIPVHWYGIAYAVGLAAVYWLATVEVRRRGLDEGLLGNGMIIVAAAALVGGRLYHVIDQWQLYKDDLLKIVLPPYTGLGVYGGIFTGTLAAILYARRHRQPLGPWADVAAPALFLMQAIGRWGNYFNQELYGPPTTLPWGIPIDCAHRVAPYFCPPAGAYPAETTFQPLFLYESLSGFLGMLVLLYLGRRFADRLLPGDLLLVFFIWYASVRFALESLRTGNWTFFGVPVAQIISAIVIVGAAAALVIRHRRSRRSAVEPALGGDPGSI